MAYVIVTVSAMHDRAMNEEYVRRFLPLIRSVGGSVLAVDESPEVKEGTWNVVRTALLFFPTVADANRFYHSSEYQEILPLRLKSVDITVVILRGVEEMAAAAKGKTQ